VHHHKLDSNHLLFVDQAEGVLAEHNTGDIHKAPWVEEHHRVQDAVAVAVAASAVAVVVYIAAAAAVAVDAVADLAEPFAKTLVQ